MIHDLKTIPEIWDKVDAREKNFEVRFDDRGYKVGDILRLFRSTSPDFQKENFIHRRVTYILQGGQFGIEPDYVVMGLGEVGQ